MKLRLYAALGLICLVVVALPVRAQTTGAVEGTITDSSNVPLPGVSVTLTSPSLQGTRTAVSAADGHYRFPALPPGVYTVSAALSGFKNVTKNGVKVNLDATASAPIRMEISVAAEVVVTGEAPVVDTTSNTNGLNVRSEIVQKLPLGRNYASAVEINPGVARDTADTQGRALTFTIYGATSIENQYLVDGVNTTNVIRGMQSKALSQEFVEEVQVKAGGYEAEYGRAMGGIVNVVTKSGGNEFHGDAFGYFDRKSLTADRKTSAETDGNYTDTTKRNVEDYGADLGGYFLRDRVWFFGAYNRVNTDVDQVPLAGTGLPNAGVNLPISFHADLFSGKLTGRPTDSTTVVGTIFGDPEVRVGALRNFNSGTNTIGILASDATRNGTEKLGATDWSVGATQLFSTVGLADVRYSRHKDRITMKEDAVGVVGYRDFVPDPNNPTFSGGFGPLTGYFQNNISRRDAIKASGSLFVSTHEIKGGVDYENNVTTSSDYFTAGQIIRIYPCGSTRCPNGGYPGTLPDGTATQVYFGHEFYSTTTDKNTAADFILPNGNTVEPHVYRLGFFLQDSWKIMPNLTVNAGIRYDQEDIRKFDGGDILNERVVDGAGNVIQQGGQKFKLTNEWQPRIGIAWDPMKDGSTKVSASYGRFYYALPTDLTVRSYGQKADIRIYNLVPDTGAGALVHDPNVARGTFAQGGYAPEPFQDDLKGIYQDEFALGFEKAIDPTFSVGVRYTYRNLGRTIEDRCDFDDAYPEANGNTCVIINPGSSSPFATGQGVHTCDGRDYVDASNNSPESDCTGPQTTNVAIPAAERKFHGVELVVKKRLSSQLWLQASYLWSHLYGNYDGEASIGQAQFPGGGQTDPGINADYDYPGFLTHAKGDLFLDRRHSFRFDGAYTSPFGLTFGLNAFLRSGAPISKYGYFNGGYFSEANFVTARGSEGRLPWDYEVSASASYAIHFNPVTVTLFAQAFNLLDKQNVIGVDQNCTVLPPDNTNPSGPGSVADCNPATNGGANPDHLKTAWRGNPRSIRLGARVSF